MQYSATLALLPHLGSVLQTLAFWNLFSSPLLVRRILWSARTGPGTCGCTHLEIHSDPSALIPCLRTTFPRTGGGLAS
jgi:hypothetical protein